VRRGEGIGVEIDHLLQGSAGDIGSGRRAVSFIVWLAQVLDGVLVRTLEPMRRVIVDAS